MVISHRHRYLYFVIPKCGSSTLRHSLEPFTDIGYPVTPFPQHMDLREFWQLDDASQMFNEYIKFTFVRNPYDRIYSGFLQDIFASKTWEKWILAKAAIFGSIGEDFNKYIEEFAATADLMNDWRWITFKPMTAFTNQDRKFSLDWFGKVEQFSNDIQKLSSICNIQIKKARDRNVNSAQTDRYKYINKYTKSSIKWINETYADDFATFDYEILCPSEFPDKL